SRHERSSFAAGRAGPRPASLAERWPHRLERRASPPSYGRAVSALGVRLRATVGADISVAREGERTLRLLARRLAAEHVAGLIVEQRESRLTLSRRGHPGRVVVFVGQSGDVLILESHAGGSVSLRQFGLNAEQLSFIELARAWTAARGARAGPLRRDRSRA